MAFDPYATLGVSKTATQDELKSAYRKLAKKLHPDLNPGNKEIENKFKEVNKAYELVGTEEARAKFDRGETQEQQEEAFRNARRGGRQGPFYSETQNEPGGRYSSNFEGFDPSFFENIFGEDLYRGRRQSNRGDDQYYSMEIDFNTSILGGEREITLPTGSRLKVKIPQGIREGQKLRLAGQGSPGPKGGQSGDVYVEIHVASSPLFRRIGNDIELDLPLSLAEIILGGDVRVPTVEGEVMVKVPKGLSSGSRIRIKGKGVPTGTTRGDQFAVVKIVVPKVDAEVEGAVKRWSEKNHFNPRSDWEKR